ncbi:MAG: YndJ family protein [Lysinibacillus sp.]
MLVNLRKSLFSPLTIVGWLLFGVCLLLHTQSSYLLLLTVAQLVFVPATLQIIIPIKRWHMPIILTGMLAVTSLHIWNEGLAAILFAFVYLLYTAFVAYLGINRFMRRGFTNMAEIAIDVGLIYLCIGGLWFFAYIANIDTGFSPLITWLTAIHFHYSAFLFAISVGLFGRLCTTRLYTPITLIVLAGPLLVAIGISFSRIVEVVSVMLYIGAIYALFFLALRARFHNIWQAIFIRISFGTLCLTILWSLLYAIGNASGHIMISIDRMIVLHGFFNCILFGLFSVLGWSLEPPSTKQLPWTFPVSHIRGKLTTTGEPHPGLVDHLDAFVDTISLPKAITHFYENTGQYQLFASVKWRAWFKPFAIFYKLISTRTQQLNLPLSQKEVEMTGTITTISENEDGRIKPRAWIRKVDAQTTFVALYSKHQTAQTTYMNIALPLPYSTMVGILKLNSHDGQLSLTSQDGGDTGIYLAFRSNLIKLPLHEHFTITASNEKTLSATHQMWIFGLPFLNIHYRILRKD